MSSLSVCIDYNHYNPSQLSEGTSAEAIKVHSLGEKAFSSFYEASTLSYKIVTSSYVLSEIGADCQDEGWDGYDALPVRQEALIEALKLIRMLPSFVPLPKILPEPSGGVTLRWKSGLLKSLLFAIKGDRNIIYAAISGPEKSHGQFYFTDFMPKKVPELLLNDGR